MLKHAGLHGYNVCQARSNNTGPRLTSFGDQDTEDSDWLPRHKQNCAGETASLP